MGFAGQRISNPMKALLLALLAASLAANVILGLRHSPPSETAAASAAISASPAHVAASSLQSDRNPTTVDSTATEAIAAWQPVHTEKDIARMIAGLRAAGYPPAVLRAMVNALLDEQFAGRQPDNALPFWKRQAPGDKILAARSALKAERQALFEQLLGPDARPSAMIPAKDREWRYGALPDAKVDAIAKIERDYNDLNADTWAKRRGNAITNMDTVLQSQAMIEKEKLADIAALLTPDELAEYQMRNSPAANALIHNLSNIDVTSEEYAQLYQVQKAFTDANPTKAMWSGSEMAQRTTAQLATNEQIRAVLGDDRFYAYAASADPQYAGVGRSLAAYPSVTPAAAYQVYQLQVEIQGVFRSATPGRAPSSDEMAAMRAKSAAINARLDALIGSDIADAYRKAGMGQVFNSLRR